MAQRRGKRYTELAKKVERGHEYTPDEGVKLVKETSGAKFDTTVEIHLRMGVDPKQADQMVRGAAVLPHGTGKTVRVIAFAQADKARDAKAAGADEVGTDDLAKKIEGGWLDFDVAIASPDMMRFVGKLGRVLGPVGKMPSPKSGTVTPDVATAVREFKAGKIEYRTDDAGNVHAPVGRKSFDAKLLEENVNAFIEHIKAGRPASAKGTFLEKASIALTMGPGVGLVVR